MPMPRPARYDFVVGRRSDSNAYQVWRFDPDTPELLHPMPLSDKASFPASHTLVPIGRYLLEYGPAQLSEYSAVFPYRLFEFDPNSPDPLAGKPVQKGLWPRSKFWMYRPDFANPGGAKEGFDTANDLMLVPLGSFLLHLIPTMGRTTYHLWNFDPNPFPHHYSDPLPAPYTPTGSIEGLHADSQLIPLGNYALEWTPGKDGSDYYLWSFDPQGRPPLAMPAVQQGRWTHLTDQSRLIAVGEQVLDWNPGDRSWRLWDVDVRQADPLVGPVRHGMLPDSVDASTTLLAVQPPLPIDDARAQIPGTVDFMRSRIEHVVYLMLENRSFDHVLGWLYEQGETGIRFVGHDKPFDGLKPEMNNLNPRNGNQPVYVQKYMKGDFGQEENLDFLPNDPYHDKSDVMRQFFFDHRDGYAQRRKPDMGGFVWNNGVEEVMWSYTPQQLPVLNGLAAQFAVSDEWFSSMPGATDPNRAFAFTGSAMGTLNNFQNGAEYTYWNLTPRRASIWKTLWANGFTDFKLYHSVEWMNYIHTYHLFLEGQIPTVDANTSTYLADINRFKADALAGKLPAFSLLEPAWIAPVGTTSYHPGADLVPGERALADLYQVLRASPAWEKTLFVVTFDEHGGIYDHAPPPYTVNPWPQDTRDGFHYDLMGVRVPTLLISPWIDAQTVFRSGQETPFDSTSFLSTLLQWAGIPRSRWAMGDRVQQAPSFEAALRRSTPRDDAPETLVTPYDKTFPPEGGVKGPLPIHDLHRLMAPRALQHLLADRMPPAEAAAIAEDLLNECQDAQALSDAIQRLVKAGR